MSAILDKAQSLEVVYYGSPVPISATSLTFLALVFDRIHFPNVYLPRKGFDLDAVKAERDRIQSLGVHDYDTAVLLSVMRFLEISSQLKEVCYFTGEHGQVFGGVDKGAAEIVNVLDELMFGPPRPDFIPMHTPGYHKGLPGGEKYIDYPGPLYYPANALIYAARH